MTRPAIARALPLALAAGLSCAALACTALSPAGNGGWSEARRQQELARARAMSAVVAPLAETDRAAPRRLDLTTALDLASRHNRTIAAAGAAVEAAAGDVAVARAALLPTNSIRGAYNWYSDEQTNSVDLDPAIFQLPPNTPLPVVTVREQDFATVSAAVRLAIDLSGELRHGLGAAQASFRAESARAWATRLEEESAVTAAYFGLLEAERLREVAQRTNALYRRQLSDATSRYDQGRLTRNEVLVVDVALADSLQTMLRLDNAIAVSRRRLNRTTGLDIDAPTEVDDVAGRPDLPPLEEVLAAARAGNPLVTSMLEEVQASDARLAAARRSRFPRVAVAGGYDATTQQIVSPNNYGSVGVTVDFDLVSLRREGEIAKLDAASRRSRLLLDRSVREVEALVRDSHDLVRERLAAIDLASAAVGQAEENLRIRQAQFDEGRATSDDLLDASRLAAMQRALLASALYQSHVRRAELELLTGKSLTNQRNAEQGDPTR
ncbi:MAG: TolC family protein [Candidatus Binatia bacterium]